MSCKKCETVSFVSYIILYNNFLLVCFTCLSHGVYVLLFVGQLSVPEYSGLLYDGFEDCGGLGADYEGVLEQLRRRGSFFGIFYKAPAIEQR